MTGAEFEADFLKHCTPMRINQTLPANGYVSAMAWVRDDTHHATTLYCGCDDATFWRNGRELFSKCAAHHIQPCGLARRMRTNHVYAEARP